MHSVSKTVCFGCYYIVYHGANQTIGYSPEGIAILLDGQLVRQSTLLVLEIDNQGDPGADAAIKNISEDKSLRYRMLPQWGNKK
eukprot:scaffold188248_cov34-Attheya_sp.AAC.1